MTQIVSNIRGIETPCKPITLKLFGKIISVNQKTGKVFEIPEHKITKISLDLPEVANSFLIKPQTFENLILTKDNSADATTQLLAEMVTLSDLTHTITTSDSNEYGHFGGDTKWEPLEWKKLLPFPSLDFWGMWVSICCAYVCLEISLKFFWPQLLKSGLKRIKSNFSQTNQPTEAQSGEHHAQNQPSTVVVVTPQVQPVMTPILSKWANVLSTEVTPSLG